MVTRITASSAGITVSVPGVLHAKAQGETEIRLAAEPGNLHLFDRQTGLRID